jgi:DNA repair protein RecO (recombination protein O)
MSTEKAQALVLHNVAWSETSSVVKLFTREFGKFSAVAKGARRPKSPFETALDLLSRCSVVFIRKSGDALSILTEARLQRCFRPVGGQMPALYAGFYVIELLDLLTHDFDPHPELFDLADGLLAEWGSGGGDLASVRRDIAFQPSPAESGAAAGAERPSVAAGVLHYELSALRILGFTPTLAACVECGKALAPSGRVPFGMLAGGVLCPTCRQGEHQVVSLSRAAWEALVQCSRNDDAWRCCRWERPAGSEIRGVMNRYLENLVSRRFRMHEYLPTA